MFAHPGIRNMQGRGNQNRKKVTLVTVNGVNSFRRQIFFFSSEGQKLEELILIVQTYKIKHTSAVTLNAFSQVVKSYNSILVLQVYI